MTSDATSDTLPSNRPLSSKPLRTKNLNLKFKKPRKWRMNRSFGVLFFFLIFLVLFYKLFGKGAVPKKPVIIHADR